MWSAGPVAALILLSTLSKGLPEDDFRIINKQDLLASDSDIFEDNSTKSFSQLLFDVARDQIVVGARDALYRLSLRGLRQLERADWPAPPDKSQLCQDKGQTEEDCHNHIKVLLSYGHKLFACGTNAFSPMCSWREIESIGSVLQWVSGVAHCPYSPRSHSTALLAGSGEYYAGTSADFSSSDIAICRSRGASARNVVTLRTTQYDLNWLNEPQFVASFEDDSFVYFVFREVAVEFLNCGKIIYSRIGRVCKNDSGGHLMMKENWSTFLKARLNCSAPGDYPFYYDEVQSAEYLQEEKLLVATFTTPSNSIAGSAICVYNMSDITAAFEGPYKVQDSPTRTWEPRSPTPQARDHFRCIPDTRPQHVIEYHRYYLMYDSIQPSTGEPIYQTTLERFTKTTVDVTLSKNIGKQLVVFVATEKNEIWKLSVLPRLEGACLVEKWMLNDQEGAFNVLTMQFVKETMSVYIGSDKSLLRLIAHRCERYKSRATCGAANDPHCGWDHLRDQCVDATSRLHDPHFAQDTSVCASSNTVVDGGWSSWSAWESCVQDNTHSPYDDKPDTCQCRTRRCDNPRPNNGGMGCEGASIAVTNCTVHGGWAAWSAWSACSATCGIAVKTRRRACSAPEPAFNGRGCVGLDSQELYCTSLPPCPDPALEPVDGGWSTWGPWSPCSSEGGPGCGPGAGWKERKRICNNPSPKYGGSDCEGSKVERQICDLRACEVRKATAWTPWVMIPDNTSDGSYTERRFKFLCKAPSPEQVKLSISKEEERYCTSEGACSDTPIETSRGSWTPWGAWGPCSVPCGGGQQTRSRKCRGACRGATDMLRACNTHACTAGAEWSCWSEWGPCSAACGQSGYRTRGRSCLAGAAGCDDAAPAAERRHCLGECDDETGWGEWGDWSECANGERIRKRSCLHGACTGALMQVAHCGDDDEDNELSAMPAYSQNVEVASFVTAGGGGPMSVASLVACVISAFAFGILAALAVTVFLSRRGGVRGWKWRRGGRVPSSPHYLTAKQNSYVTVPLKDVPRKPKRQPSFSGITSGTLLKSNNMNNANNHNTLTTPKLYPKAIANEYDSMGTLRRHSNLPSHRNNLDADEDKFY